MKPATGAAVAVLLVGLLVLSGCASPSAPSSSSTTSKRPTTAPTTRAATTATTTTLPPATTAVTTTTTATTTTTTTTSPPPPPPPPGGGAPPNEPPVLTIPIPPSVGINDATLTWRVEDGDSDTGVSSWAEYGVGAGNYSLSTARQGGTGQRSDTVTGLKSCTMYGWRARASDGPNTVSRENSPATFTTAGAAPSITNVNVVDVLDNSMRIAWDLAGPTDSRSQVLYGTTTALGSSTPKLTGTGPRTATLTGLTQNTDYNFRVHAENPCGTSQTSIQVRRTALVVHVTIDNLGLGGYFDPGSTGYPWGPANGRDPIPPGGRPLVFEIRNDDSAPHSWYVQGVSPAYGSTTIAAGTTYHFPASIVLTTGVTYHMKSAYPGDSAMDGTITPT